MGPIETPPQTSRYNIAVMYEGVLGLHNWDPIEARGPASRNAKRLIVAVIPRTDPVNFSEPSDSIKFVVLFCYELNSCFTTIICEQKLNQSVP